MGRRDSDDWRGWKDGKYDNRYSKNYRRNRNKTKSVTVGIVFLLIIGVFGFILLEQGYLDESIQNTPQEVQDISTTAKNFAIETTKKLSETINEQLENIPLELIEKNYDDITETELQKMVVEWNYNDIVRGIDNYQGKIIRVEGEVHRTETISEDSLNILILTNPKKFPTPGKHNYMMIKDSSERFLNDDRIVVWGKVQSISNHPTLFGAEQSMPVIKAIKIDCLRCP